MNARPVAAEQGFVFPETIPSAVTYAEAVRLHAEAKGKIVLEMGAQFGLSTIVLAQSARHVVSVDWHRGDVQAGMLDTLAGYWRNLKAHRVDHKVTVIADRFESALSYLKPACFDVVFIDGCHDEEAVQADPIRDRVNVYVFAGPHALTPEGWVDYDEDAQCMDPPRFLSVDVDVFDAIMRATADRPNTTTAQDAINDARAVRDRMIALVEKLAE